jgi:hypothetical protein
MKTSPPDLQELVAAVGGYDKITPEMRAAFDAAIDAYQQMRRNELANDKAARDGPAAIGAPEQAWPFMRCVVCRAEPQFGYRRDGVLRWFCASHRLARC